VVPGPSSVHPLRPSAVQRQVVCPDLMTFKKCVGCSCSGTAQAGIWSNDSIAMPFHPTCRLEIDEAIGIGDTKRSPRRTSICRMGRMPVVLDNSAFSFLRQVTIQKSLLHM